MYLHSYTYVRATCIYVDIVQCFHSSFNSINIIHMLMVGSGEHRSIIWPTKPVINGCHHVNDMDNLILLGY